MTSFTKMTSFIFVMTKINEPAIESSNSVKRLGVTIDSKFSFNDHITNLCR